MGVDPFIKIYPNYNLLLLIIDAGLSGLSVDLFLLFPKRIERENIDGVDRGEREKKRCYQQEERKGGRRDFTSKKRELVKKRCYHQEERDRETLENNFYQKPSCLLAKSSASSLWNQTIIDNRENNSDQSWTVFIFQLIVVVVVVHLLQLWKLVLDCLDGCLLLLSWLRINWQNVVERLVIGIMTGIVGFFCWENAPLRESEEPPGALQSSSLNNLECRARDLPAQASFF